MRWIKVNFWRLKKGGGQWHQDLLIYWTELSIDLDYLISSNELLRSKRKVTEFSSLQILQSGSNPRQLNCKAFLDWKGLHLDYLLEYYSNNKYSYSYLITNWNPNIIRICIRPKIWVRILFVFVFVQKFGSKYYSYSSKNSGPKIILIRI